MTKLPTSTPNRRTLLSALGTGLATSLIGTGSNAAQAESQYVLVQGDDCVPVRPLRGDEPAEAFYEYQLPERYVTDDNGAVAGETTSFASAGTVDLQRPQTSIIFLYEGPDGLSLVVVHGSVENDDAGSVTFELAGLPENGEWVVMDDYYLNPDTGEIADTNYDRWDVDGTDHRVDWTWGSSGTDGGVFRSLGDAFDVAIRPGFNEDSPLYDEHYQGRITDWEFLSGTDGDPERLSLDLAAPIRIATGGCGDAATPTEDGSQTERPEREPTETDTPQETETETATETAEPTDEDVQQDQNIDVEQSQDVEADVDVETEQTQEVVTEQEQRTPTDDEDDDPDEDEENGRGKAKGRGNNGRGKGHDKGRGKGHEKGRGKGHEKHGDDEDGDD